MLKQAWRSYLASLHPRNLKKLNHLSAGGWSIYWLLTWPILMNSSGDETGITASYMWTRVIPFLIMSWSNISSRYLLTKQMFLCPMKREDREKYVRYVLYFKIGFPVLVGICLELAWSFVIGFHLYRMLLFAFIYLSMGIVIYICIDGTGWADKKITWARKGKDGKLHWAPINIISFVCGMLMLFCMEGANMMKELYLVDKVLIVSGVVIQAVCNVLVLLTQYKDIIEQASNYEETFHILGKVPEVKYDLFAKKR